MTDRVTVLPWATLRQCLPWILAWVGAVLWFVVDAHASDRDKMREHAHATMQHVLGPRSELLMWVRKPRRGKYAGLVLEAARRSAGKVLDRRERSLTLCFLLEHSTDISSGAGEREALAQLLARVLADRIGLAGATDRGNRLDRVAYGLKPRTALALCRTVMRWGNEDDREMAKDYLRVLQNDTGPEWADVQVCASGLLARSGEPVSQTVARRAQRLMRASLLCSGSLCVYDWKGLPDDWCVAALEEAHQALAGCQVDTPFPNHQASGWSWAAKSNRLPAMRREELLQALTKSSSPHLAQAAWTTLAEIAPEDCRAWLEEEAAAEKSPRRLIWLAGRLWHTSSKLKGKLRCQAIAALGTDPPAVRWDLAFRLWKVGFLADADIRRELVRLIAALHVLLEKGELTGGQEVKVLRPLKELSPEVVVQMRHQLLREAIALFSPLDLQRAREGPERRSSMSHLREALSVALLTLWLGDE